MPTLAQVLGVVGAEGRRDRLADYLASKRILLVLDNFEQVIDAAPDVADSGRCPRLSVIVTSREPLRVSRRARVPRAAARASRTAADVADRRRSRAYDAVALFVERARGVRAGLRADRGERRRRRGDLRAASTGCRWRSSWRRRGSAACRRRRSWRARSRSRCWPAARGTCPSGSRRCAAAIAWSHDLLDEGDRTFFARFAVFAGGAELSAVEEVICDSGSAGGALEDVESLLDKSLVRLETSRAGESRYGMLETIREFAFQQLAERGEVDLISERQATWVAKFVEREARSVLSADRRTVLDRYEVEHDNIRAALAWSLASGHGQLAERVFTSTWRFWQTRGFLAEARRYAELVTALPTTPEDREQRALAIEAAGGIAYWQGDMERSLAWYQQSLDLAREQGDPSRIANALYNMIFAVAQTAGLGEAMKVADEAMDLYRSLGDDQGLGRVAWGISSTYYFEGDVEGGIALSQQALDIFERTGDVFMTAWAHYMVGVFHLTIDTDEMRRNLEAAHHLFVEANDTSGLALVFDALATLAMRGGRVETAMRLAGYAGTIEQTSGTGLAKMNRDQAGFSPETLAQDPALAAAYEEGRQLTLEQATALALPQESPSTAADD